VQERLSGIVQALGFLVRTPVPLGLAPDYNADGQADYGDNDLHMGASIP
jgi:hypothetical protein